MAGLERRVRELAEKLEELSSWAKKYQELSKKNEVTYEFDFLESVKIEEKDTTV
jgi:hypothetical protein